MVSGSSELGIDGLAQRSSSVTSQARLKAHVWVMSLPGLALIASCHLSHYLFHAATLPPFTVSTTVSSNNKRGARKP